MELLMTAIDYFLHVDRHLLDFAMAYGVWIYALLFLIVFLETGVVVTPFLPGDSLLFATGALAAAGVIDIVGILALLTRFVPIVRTFAPFVAGVGRMHYPRFLAFDVGGGILWVWSFGLLGYFFGNAPIVKENFGLAIIAVIVISLLPLAFEAWRGRLNRARAGS